MGKFTRLEPTAQIGAMPLRHERALDGLRGLAALTVLYGHVVIARWVDPQWMPAAFWRDWEAGGGAVLIFFVLSGHVIGLTNRHPFHVLTARAYLGRRILRLAPINTVAVCLAIVAAGTGLTLGAVGGNLFFLQNDLWVGAPPVLASNPNLWSLHYEAVYYLLFLFLWWGRPRADLLLAGLLLTSIIAWWPPVATPALAAYACGLLFWAGGLWIAWHCPPASGPRASGGNWPTAALVAFVTWKMGFLAAICHRFGLATPENTWIGPWRLDFLPVALWLVAAIAKRNLPRLLPAVSCSWLAVNFLWRLIRGTAIVNQSDALYLALFGLALMLWAWRPETGLLARVGPLGDISYAMYAISFPVMRIIRNLAPDWTGSAATFGVRLTMDCTVIFLIAWSLDARLQPWLRRRLLPPGRISMMTAPVGAGRHKLDLPAKSRD